MTSVNLVMQNEIVLSGCGPEPLSSYLTALGVFRIMSEQVDRDARARWVDNSFHIQSALTRDELVRFLLDSYRPTPLISPWNNGSGFFGDKTAAKTLSSLSESDSPRLAEYRATITAARQVLSHDEGEARKAANQKEKQKVMRLCRAVLPDSAVQWLDSTYVLAEGKPRYAPILGTGANDGNMDFTANFMQNLAIVMPFQEATAKKSRRGRKSVYSRELSESYLIDALFGGEEVALVDNASGQFNPGAIGGPNATRGFDGGTLLNPWAYILALEGTLLFAGSVVWRFGTSTRGMAAFPFSVNPSSAASGPATKSDAEARAETWMPLWEKPATLAELEALFTEGRVQVGKRMAANGTDFVRALASLGTDRGITQFVRYRFVQRSGRSYLSVPAGTYQVKERSAAYLLTQADARLDQLRRLAGSRGDGPQIYLDILRQIEGAIFAYCAHGRKADFAKVLQLLGRSERILALRPKARAEAHPLRDLGEEWILECPNTPELRLALAIASIDDKEAGPLRADLEPVKREKGRWAWRSVDGTITPYGSHLIPALGDILRRRMIVSGQKNLAHLPIDSPFVASLSDVARFMSGSVDDEMILDLVWALGAVRIDSSPHKIQPTLGDASDVTAVPRAYALLKLLFLPRSAAAAVLRRRGDCDGIDYVPADPSVLTRLAGGDLDAAVRIAVRRLVGSGLVPFGTAKDRNRNLDFSVGPGVLQRLRAAMLIPVARADRLADLVLQSSIVDYEKGV